MSTTRPEECDNVSDREQRTSAKWTVRLLWTATTSATHLIGAYVQKGPDGAEICERREGRHDV